MRALSIQQPWAWLICNPTAYAEPKRVENRTWPTNYRGRFLVHAGLAEDREALPAIQRTRPELAALLFELQFKGALPRGGIVGVARLVGCKPVEELPQGEFADPWAVGPFCLDLLEAEPLPFLPLKGRLGWFEADYPGQTEDGGRR